MSESSGRLGENPGSREGQPEAQSATYRRWYDHDPMLVEVLDFERNTPIGWVRWRDHDGNLMVFPNITSDRLPVMTTAL